MFRNWVGTVGTQIRARIVPTASIPAIVPTRGNIYMPATIGGCVQASYSLSLLVGTVGTPGTVALI